MKLTYNQFVQLFDASTAFRQLVFKQVAQESVLNNIIKMSTFLASMCSLCDNNKIRAIKQVRVFSALVGPSLLIEMFDLPEPQDTGDSVLGLVNSKRLVELVWDFNNNQPMTH